MNKYEYIGVPLTAVLIAFAVLVALFINDMWKSGLHGPEELSSIERNIATMCADTIRQAHSNLTQAEQSSLIVQCRQEQMNYLIQWENKVHEERSRKKDCCDSECTRK